LPKSLDDYIQLRKVLGQQGFALSHGSPVLVGLGVMGELSEDGERGDAETFLAAIHGMKEQRAIHRRVWEVKQRREGPGLKYTRLGRSADNDMVLPDYAISLVHCGFDRNPDGHIVIFDLDSHNGTHVNSTRLAPFQELPLSSEDEVILGRYLFEYLDTRTFLDRVENMYVMTFT